MKLYLCPNQYLKLKFPCLEKCCGLQFAYLSHLFLNGRSFKTLTKLDLSYNDLKSLISILELLFKIPWLKELNLTSNGFDDESLRRVPGSVNMECTDICNFCF